MSSKLPQSIDMPGPNGAVTQGGTVDFSSLERAFEGAGRELQQYDEARKKADDDIAVRELEAAQGAYAGGAIERATMYDGRQPGFAQVELQAFDETIAPLLAREDLADGVRDRLTQRSRELRTRVGAQAIATEARARGARSAADRDAAEQAEAYRAIMAFNEVFDGLEDARRAQYGITPGYAKGLAGDFNFAREQVLANLPEPIAERVRASLQSREVTLQATAMAQEDEARDADVLNTVTAAVTGLGNRATRDPSVLVRWEEEFAPIRAMLPAHLRVEAEKEAKQDIFSRALETRIQSGEFEVVRDEIAAGRYDWMDPDVVERLNEEIKTADAVRTVEDVQAEADLVAQVDLDLKNILNGSPADATLARRAEEMGQVELAVKIRTDQAVAVNIRPLMGRLRTLGPDELTAELERLAAASGDAVGARTLELARSVIEQSQTLKGSDPAAWTATAIGQGDRVANEVQARLTAFEAAPSQETAQAYARATWAAQMAGGVGQQQRRILQAATAQAWVERLDADGAPAAALPELAQRLALFGPGFRPQVTRELGLAGLKPADLGALTHYSESPARMRDYVRGRAAMAALTPENVRSNGAAGLVESDARQEVETALNRALAPYNAALASGQGMDATREAARTVAFGLVARGARVQDAVRQATAPMTEGWSFEGSWAIPVNAGLNEDRVRGNTRLLFANLISGGGRGLYAPPSSRYTPEQSRRNYVDVVRQHGQWRNLIDGTGIELVTPSADNRAWIRVRDAEGRDVVRTWRQLEEGPRGER